RNTGSRSPGSCLGFGWDRAVTGPSYRSVAFMARLVTCVARPPMLGSFYASDEGAMRGKHYEKLIFRRADAITTIMLNRPMVHNALDRQLSDELTHAVRAVRDDRSCRIMILRGAGDTFCAGDDVREFNEWSSDDGYWQVRLYQETVQIIENLTALTIAAV